MKTDEVKVVDKFPPGIPYIVGNEGAERFSFYGMKAILKVYLIDLFLRFGDHATVSDVMMGEVRARSTEVYHLFVAGTYAFPLLGAVIADRLLGKYRTILWVSLIYCAGHAVLAVAGRMGALAQYEAAEMSMYLGLGLIALGAGGIKPCVSANVGDQFTSENAHLVTKVFQVFYFMINFGSFFSTLLTPLLLSWYGPEIAFGVPGVLMGLATIVFWMGRNKFIHVPPTPGGKLGMLDSLVTTLLFTPLFAIIAGYFVFWAKFQVQSPDGGAREFFGQYWWLPVATIVSFLAGCLLFRARQKMETSTGFLPVLLYNLTHQSERRPGTSFFDVGRARFGEEAGDGPPAVLKVMVVFSMVSVFWALFDQHGSTWVDQAQQMALSLRVPAYLGYWALAATVAISLFGFVWIFSWVANAAIPKRVSVMFLGAILASAVVAGACDLMAPPLGDVIQTADGGTARERMLTVPLDAAQISALNPLFVMIIIPALGILVYEPLRKRGIEVKPLQKMTVGMFLTAAAFGSAAVLQEAIQRQGPGQVHVLWQVVQYFIITIAEVLVSVTGLEFAYTQAPRAMKSTIMSFWLLCVTFGSLLVAFLSPLQKVYALSQFFWLFTGIMAAAATIFLVLSLFYKGKTYLQH